MMQLPLQTKITVLKMLQSKLWYLFCFLVHIIFHLQYSSVRNNWPCRFISGKVCLNFNKSSKYFQTVLYLIWYDIFFNLQWQFLLSLIIHQYKGVNCNDIDANIIKADAIVMAIPAGPSASVEIKPKLSLQKTHALRTTPYSSSTKVGVTSRFKFYVGHS